jgi:hypothetical protein
MKIEISRSSLISQKLGIVVYISSGMKVYSSSGEYPNIRFYYNFERIEIETLNQKKVIIEK